MGIFHIQWKPLNRDASGVRNLSRITDCPDYPISIARYEFVLKNVFRNVYTVDISFSDNAGDISNYHFPSFTIDQISMVCI